MKFKRPLRILRNYMNSVHPESGTEAVYES